jgi:hypothetical protein
MPLRSAQGDSEKPGYGGAILTNVSFYNALGQLVRTTATYTSGDHRFSGQAHPSHPATRLSLSERENGFMVRLLGSKSNATIKKRPPTP